MNIKEIAKACHEVNRALCLAHGDTSQLPWDEAPEWQRESAVAGVQFQLANPGAPVSATHDAWSRDKIAAGWIYGEVKNADAVPPTHPCLVDFVQLPPEQKAKDFVFKAVVNSLKSFLSE